MINYDVNTISINDVIHTLSECARDRRVDGMFEHMLTFASELTGLSEDALLESLPSEKETVVVKSMDELKAYLEDHGWDVSWCNFYMGHVGWEISQYSPAGEDFNFAIEHDDNVEKAVKAIKEYAYDFDVDEHVQLNVGTRGAPDIRTLVEDADAIQEMLTELADGCNWCDQMTIGELCSSVSLDDKIQSAASGSLESKTAAKEKETSPDLSI